jgi:hypothetical protein
MSKHGMMLLAKTLKLFGEIERCQDHSINRVDVADASADLPNLIVDRRREITSPLVAAVACDGQAVAHDLDADAFHGLTEVQSVESAKNLFDPRFDLITRILMLS